MAFGVIRFMPSDHGYPFVRWRGVAYVVSSIMMAAALLLLVTAGLNFGIDFRGGTLIQAGNPQAEDIQTFVQTLDEDLDGVEVEITDNAGETEDGRATELVIAMTGANAAASADSIDNAIVGGGEDVTGARFSCVTSDGAETTDDGARIALHLPPPLPPLDDIRANLSALGLGNIQAQEFGGPDTLLIRVETQDAAEGEDEGDAQQRAADLVRTTLLEMAPMCILRTEVVGATVSGELIRNGVLAIVIALVLMLAYIWFRFDGWQFSVGAVAALVHDVLITLGVLSLTGFEFNLPSIAAILTIIGYSMNDTVVVYDRIREKMRKYKKMPMDELINFAINKTLSRTIMTSVTTLIALGSLFVLGGEVLRGFSFTMIWGVVIGTYSSIFVAAPVLLVLGVRQGGGAGASTSQSGADARP